MDNCKIVVDYDQVNHAFYEEGNKIDKRLSDLTTEIMMEGAFYLDSLLPEKTGKLKDSLHFNNNSIWTTEGKVYGYLDKGTKPHKIRGINGMLRFECMGDIMFRKEVNHPGIKARKYTDKVFKFCANPAFNKAVDKLLKQIWSETPSFKVKTSYEKWS